MTVAGISPGAALGQSGVGVGGLSRRPAPAASPEEPFRGGSADHVPNASLTAPACGGRHRGLRHAPGLRRSRAGTGTQASDPQGAGAPAKRPVTVIVDNDWTEGDRYTVVQAWLARANKVYPHIKTELRDNAASQDKTLALFATGEQGDLYQLDQHVVPVFGPKGVLQDIGPTLAALKFDVNSVYDVPNITHWNGKRHGLMIQLQTFTTIYNVDAFQKEGVAVPAASWTWDDWLEVARKLNKPLEATPRWGTTLSGEPYHMFWSADAPYLNQNGTATLWDTPACRAVVQWMVDLTQRHRVTPTPAEATEKKLNFNNGNYAINPYAQPSPGITKAIDGQFQWDVCPGRSTPGRERGSSSPAGTTT